LWCWSECWTYTAVDHWRNVDATLLKCRVAGFAIGTPLTRCLRMECSFVGALFTNAKCRARCTRRRSRRWRWLTNYKLHTFYKQHHFDCLYLWSRLWCWSGRWFRRRFRSWSRRWLRKTKCQKTQICDTQCNVVIKDFTA
jgi:hypothetical protein